MESDRKELPSWSDLPSAPTVSKVAHVAIVHGEYWEDNPREIIYLLGEKVAEQMYEGGIAPVSVASSDHQVKAESCDSCTHLEEEHLHVTLTAWGLTPKDRIAEVYTHQQCGAAMTVKPIDHDGFIEKQMRCERCQPET